MIVLSKINKSFGDKQVLQDFSCTLQKGQVTALLGPSGCGKTTLLRILAGLESPDSGTISGLENMRKSAVFQENRLLPFLTAWGNIRFVNPSLSKEAVEKDLQLLGLGDSLHLPVSQFSGGMKRRTAILRALLAPYDILFMDEPFQGLDPATKTQVMTYFRQKTQGKTVVLVTHDREEAQKLSQQQICFSGEGGCTSFSTHV